jgi:general secretion pathway protein K
VTTTAPRPRLPRRQRGTALLLAMVIMTLIATLASAMVAQQQRAIAVEAAERARGQAAWVLVGALDWARLVLREDARSGSVDSLGEPWAVPLAEARLSTFLAADRESPGADEGPAAFLSGQVLDEQARYNLHNLLDDQGKVVEAEAAVLQRLCRIIGLPDDLAPRIVEGMLAAVGEGDESAPLLPMRLEQLAWLGVDADSIAQLRPFVTLLPSATAVNVNTAPREVLAAAIDGLDLGGAERLLQRRQRAAYASMDDLRKELPQGLPELPETRLSVGSRYFEVIGRLRLDERVFEERSIVERRPADRGGEIVAIQRERRSIAQGTPR